MIAEAETTSAVSKLTGRELRTLLLHSSHYLMGLVGSMAIGLVSFPIFTRVFSVSEYGLLDLAQKVVLMLTIGSKAGLQNAALRFYDKDAFAANPAAARKYYSTMYLGTAATSVSFVLVFVAAARAGLAGLFGGPLGSLVYLISALVLLRATGAILWGFLRIEERTKLFNGAAVGTKAATIAAICALLPLLGRTAGTYLAGVIAVETVLVVTLTVPLLSCGLLNPECFDRALFRAGVFYGMPLAVYEFAFAVLGSADRFLVTYYLGPGALGFYSVAYGLAQHANELLVTPLILAILPIYMRIWTSSGAEKTQEFLSISLELFVATAAGILAVAVAAARPAVLILASSKYAGAERMIPVLLAGLLIYATYVFLAAGLLIHKRTLQMAVLLVIAAAANIALNCLLLPRMGLMGSAVATLLSYALCIVLLGRASSRLLPLRISPVAVLKFLAAAAVAAFAGARFDFGSVAADLAAKSGIAAALYCAALFVLDGRVRRGARWAYAECRSRL